MGLTQATGWVACYRDSPERKVVLWSDGPVVRGYVVDDAGHLIAADRFGNFAGYAEDEHHRQVLPAPPGWWVVYDNGEWREPVIAWLVDPTGYAVEAITPPDRSGIVCPDAPSKTNALEFRYDPAWVQPKPWPP
jgi:hypothetical protein